MTPRVGGLLAALAVLASCAAGCSGGANPDRSETSAPAEPSSAEPSSAGGTPTTAPSATSSPDPTPGAVALRAGAYRAALRDLVLADTAGFEQVVVINRDVDPDSLSVLPRSSGTWRISTSESATSSRFLGEDGTVTLSQRQVDGTSFFRVDAEGTIFGADCWLQLDADAPELAGTPQSERGFGLPAALYLLDGYRPAGRPDAGTASLGDVLGAVGFQKVVSQDIGHLRGRRVPVELQLRDGRFHRAIVLPDDVVRALRADGPAPAATAALAQLIDALPRLFWGIEYSDLGAAIRVVPPPADRVLEAGETCPA